MNYEDYASHAFKQFSQAHDQWQLTDGINDWESWFYEQKTGLLTFSTGEQKANYRYVPVGSYSTKTGTWLWAWSNLHSIHPQKKLTDVVRRFGEKHGYEELSEGHFPCDGDPGWEFTGIAYDRLGGLGGYRVQTDEHLFSCMLITQKIDNEEAAYLTATTEEDAIECESHGMGRKAFTCGHLESDTKLGFNEAFTTHPGMLLGPEDDLQAWCDDCELERVKAGGWNETSQACLELKLVCETCYFILKSANLTTYNP